MRGIANDSRSDTGIRCGRPDASEVNTQVVAARETAWPLRVISVARTHDAPRTDSIHVVANSCSPSRTGAR